MLAERNLEDRRLLDALLRLALRTLRNQYRRAVVQWMRDLYGKLSPQQRVQGMLRNLLRRRIESTSGELVAALERMVLGHVEVGAARSADQLVRSAVEEKIGSIDRWFFVQQQARQERAPRVRAQARALVDGPVRRAADQVVQQVELATDASYAAQETLQALLSRVEVRAEEHWWRIARIARTSITWAFNDARIQVASAASIPEVWLRWTELVDDQTGKPLDDRVAADSMVLHGQVALPGGLFVLPPDDRVARALWNQRWAHPPNRPNDRGVLTLWQSGSGVPAWRWHQGSRVPLE